MTTNEELNTSLEEFKKAIMRHRSVELLLRASRRETKIGGMERAIYFATVDAIKALEKFEKACWDEVTRISTRYTATIAVETIRQYEENSESSRKISDVKVEIPTRAKAEVAKPKRVRKAAVEEAPAPVAKRQYNRRNGAK